MKNILSRIAQGTKSDFFRHNIVFMTGTLAISLVNYLYYPVVSRLVTVSEFGEIQAIVSLFMQLGILLTAFGYVITNIVNNARTKEESNELVLRLEQLMLVVGLVLFIGLSLSSFLFKDSFKIHSVVPVMLVGALIIINIPSTSRSYILQGLRRLKEVSIGGIVYAAGKLILSVLLIYMLVDNVSAALGGYVLAQFLMLIYLSVRLSDRYAPVGDTFRPLKLHKLSLRQRKLMRAELIYGVVVTGMLTGLTMLYSSDTIIARLFFEPHDLGIYSGISSVARIIFFLTASVAGVLIATVRLDAPPHITIHTFLKSFLLVGWIGGMATLIFSFFPGLLVRLLLGTDYLEGAKWLPLLSITMFVCSLNNLFAIYLIALRRHRAILSILAGVIAMWAGLSVFHDNLQQFIAILFVANLLASVLLGIEIWTGQIKRRSFHQ